MYCAFKKYGIENFTFSILEVVHDHSELNAVENKYIALYDTVSKGYNQIYTSRNGLSREDLNKKRENKYGVTKEQLYSKLKTCTFEDVAKHYGVCSNTIRKWCIDFGIPSNSKDYNTEVKKEYLSNKFKSIMKDREFDTKKVAMLDKTTREIIKEFDSLADASRYLNTHPSNIQRALSGRRKTSLGYCWSYIK